MRKVLIGCLSAFALLAIAKVLVAQPMADEPVMAANASNAVMEEGTAMMEGNAMMGGNAEDMGMNQ